MNLLYYGDKRFCSFFEGGRGNLRVNPCSKPSANSLSDNCHSHIVIILRAKTGVCFDESKRTCASSWDFLFMTPRHLKKFHRKMWLVAVIDKTRCESHYFCHLRPLRPRRVSNIAEKTVSGEGFCLRVTQGDRFPVRGNGSPVLRA